MNTHKSIEFIDHLMNLQTILLIAVAALGGCTEYKYYKPVATSQGSVFINGRAWGVNGNRQKWWITANKGSQEPDSASDFVFDEQTYQFLWKIDHDTLKIYSFYPVKIPSNFHSRVAVSIKHVEGEEYSHLWDQQELLKLSIAQ